MRAISQVFLKPIVSATREKLPSFKNARAISSVNSNFVKSITFERNKNCLFTSRHTKQKIANTNTGMITKSVSYKMENVPQGYVNSGLDSIGPVNDLLEATKPRIQVNLVSELKIDSELHFFYQDKDDLISSPLKCLGFEGKQGQVCTVLQDFGDPAQKENGNLNKIVAVGLGKSSECLTVNALRKTIKAAYDELKKRKIDKIGICIDGLKTDIDNFNIVYSEKDVWLEEEGQKVPHLEIYDIVKLLIETLSIQDFNVEFFKNLVRKSNDQTDEKDKEQFRLNEVLIKANLPHFTQNILKDKLNTPVVIRANAVAAGQNLAKSLTQLPANVCSTEFLKNQMIRLKEEYSSKLSDGQLQLTVMSEKEMLELGMGCLTAVGRGSETESYIVALEYKHKNSKSNQPIVLAGKGVVHDSGGLNIKLGSMDSMNKDMGGAASVIGAMRAILDLEAPTHVVGVIGIVENSVSHRSYRPGDVLRSMKGSTVEVGNTDAEGRLVLADVLYWAGKTYKPKVILDMATLTGAILVGLGLDLAGCFSNSPSLAEQLEQCGLKSFDRIHPMPLYPPYTEKLKSTVADMNNIGGPEAGSITAALFLHEFVADFRKEYQTKWAHLDIAGAAMSGKASKDLATGRCVPLLVEYLVEEAVKDIS